MRGGYTSESERKWERMRERKRKGEGERGREGEQEEEGAHLPVKVTVDAFVADVS